MPLQTWRCDSCRKPIETADQGNVVWLDTDGYQYRDFRIVHKNTGGRTCDPKSDYESNWPIEMFLGLGGLTEMLSWLVPSPMEPNDPCLIGDIGNFVEFMRRVQIPFYEEARTRSLPTVLSWLDAHQLDPADPLVIRRIAEGEADQG